MRGEVAWHCLDSQWMSTSEDEVQAWASPTCWFMDFLWMPPHYIPKRFNHSVKFIIRKPNSRWSPYPDIQKSDRTRNRKNSPVDPHYIPETLNKFVKFFRTYHPETKIRKLPYNYVLSGEGHSSRSQTVTVPMVAWWWHDTPTCGISHDGISFWWSLVPKLGLCIQLP
jgi:hypothetical protein